MPLFCIVFLWLITRRHCKPFLRVGFRGEALVVCVNFLRAIARLLCGEVFIGMKGEMKGAKAVAQAVVRARYGNVRPFDLHDCLPA